MVPDAAQVLPDGLRAPLAVLLGLRSASPPAPASAMSEAAAIQAQGSSFYTISQLSGLT